MDFFTNHNLNIMKKLLGFLIVAAIVGCTCLGQVPTQTIYAGASSCQATLPDYTKIVSVSDNCQVASFTQSPIAGTVLSTTNPQVNVLLRVIDVSGNISESRFNVVLLDTIKPVFHFPDSMLAYNVSQISGFYLAFEAWTQENIMDWMYYANWDTLRSYGVDDTLNYVIHPIQVSDEMFNAYLRRK